MRKGQLFKKKVEDPRNAWRLKVKEQQKLSFAQVVLDKKGSSSFTDEGASRFNVKVESSSWLRYLGEKMVLLSCDENGLIGKIIEDNKDWFASMFDSVLPWNVSLAVNERYAWVRCRGIPLQLWSRQCFKCIRALVGKMVEVDQATLAREVLEYARFRVWRFEEACFPEYTLRSLFSKWGACSIPVSDVSSEEGDGREFLDSVGLDSNAGNGVREGEEASVNGEVNEAGESLNEVHAPCLTSPINEVLHGINEVHTHCLTNDVLPDINEVHAHCLTSPFNEVLPGINEVLHCLTSPINEVHTPCLTNFYGRKNSIGMDDWCVGFPEALGAGVFVGIGIALEEVEHSGALALGTIRTMSPVDSAGGAGIMSSVNGAGCVSLVGDNGRVSPAGVVGHVSQGAVVLVGSPGVMLTQGLEKELSGFSPKFGMSLVEEVVPTTLEEVAGAGVKGEVSVTEGKGGVVSARLNSGSKENDCACSNARSVKVKELASILVTNEVSRSL
ncbi:hypothetical protein VNO80_16980 [Phaseolus coccineus]|uniref:DUF4283 domain-containing protein n=1 Tax=Phaseolus coccineus TaxID=3886 RepID=A0AAN9MMZ7_PHACN